MFRVVREGRVKTLGSYEELDRWVRRGKIDENDAVVAITTGREKPARDWLLDHRTSQEKKQPKSEGPDQNYDYQADIEAKIRDMRTRNAADFSNEEIEAMKRFMRFLVRYDLDRKVDQETLFRYRKMLRRTAARQIQAQAEAEADMADIRHMLGTAQHSRNQPQRSFGQQALDQARAEYAATHPHEKREVYRYARNGEQGASHQPNYTQAGYQGNLSYREVNHETVQDYKRTREDQPRRGFWHNPVIILLALIFAPPFGLILMWTAPRIGFFGNGFVRLIVTGGLIWGFVGADENDSELRRYLSQALEELNPAPVMEIGSEFDQTDWRISMVPERFIEGDTIIFVGRKLVCNEAEITEEIVKIGSKNDETVRVQKVNWGENDDRYMGSFTPENRGRYRISLYCGNESMVQDTVRVKTK